MHTERGTRAPARAFRPDIEGLRAVAVLLVVLYHAHAGPVTGGYVGVDVFFVISGFLITRQLTNELDRRGTISLAGFYARRIRRLLPASAVVTVATVLASAVVLPPLRAGSVLTDAISTAFYGINYRLAALGTNYLTASGPPSPLQHYWSLAVEEQYYLVWPLLILVFALAAARLRHRALIAVIGGLGALSLLACILLTGEAQPWAYFSLPTRAWELAVGAILSLTAGRLAALRPTAAAGLGWLGLGAVVAAGILFTDATAFPGVAALLPVLGAGAIIAAGCAAPRLGPEVLLGRGPMQWIGRLSYSWYLWHWPMLVLAPVILGQTLGVAEALAVSGMALVAAVVTYHLVETPGRSWTFLAVRPARGLAFGVGLAAMVLVSVGAASAALPSVDATGAVAAIPAASGTVAASATKASSTPFGDSVAAAVAASVGVLVAPANLAPTVSTAAQDVPVAQSDGCFALGFSVVAPSTPCIYGDPSSAPLVVLYGDSHAAQWMPALDALGRSEHWRIASRTKVSCPATTVRVNNKALKREYSECDAWRIATQAEITTLHPDVVIMASAVSVGADDVSDGDWTVGTAATIATFQRMGARVVFMADTPRTKAEALDCVGAHLSQLSACQLPAADAYYYPARRAADMAAATAAGAQVIDPNPWFCTASRCPAVVGPYLVFRDSSHVTATYATFLAPAILEQLRLSSATAGALGLGQPS